MSFPLAAIFSSASSSRSRISVGLSCNIFAVLSWLRTAAVSSRRAMRCASAAVLASVTLLSSSFISPGKMTSRTPTDDTSTPSAAARGRSRWASSRATASLSVRNVSSVRSPTAARRASWASR